MLTSIYFGSFSTFFVLCNTAFVDEIEKCSIKDNECVKKSYSTNVKKVGAEGLPEYDIPGIDPYKISNVAVAIAGLVNLTLIEGTAKGITGCEFNTFTVDIENGKMSQELTCDALTISGKYIVYSSNPLVKQLLNGSEVHGEGFGKIDIEKIWLKMDNGISLEKRDGEIYLIFDTENSNYHFDVMGKATFEADSIYLGDKEESAQILKIMNDNWKLIMSAYGKVFIGRATEFYLTFTKRFFSAVPVKHFFTDDLSAYVKN